MTPSRYLVARLAQAFGYYRKSIRMSEAASEMHLLRESEAYLGSIVWQSVDGIEALSVEYWNLRKLIKERDEVRNKLALCQEKLDRAHQERAEMLTNTPEFSEELMNERVALLKEMEDYSMQRDRIVAEARDVRRTYTGLKMKLEVLASESATSQNLPEETAKVKTRLQELKNRFAELKAERIRVGKMLEEGDSKIDLLDKKLDEQKQLRRVKASAAFQVIGEGNKEISSLRAESGLLDTRMRQLYAEIGRYVSRNANRDPACAAAAAPHHGLVDVMRALRRSIALNHRLAGTA